MVILLPLGSVLFVCCRWFIGCWPLSLKDRVKDLVPDSVFSLGNGVSSVEAWFSNALDVEEVLSGACDDQFACPSC